MDCYDYLIFINLIYMFILLMGVIIFTKPKNSSSNSLLNSSNNSQTKSNYFPCNLRPSQ